MHGRSIRMLAAIVVLGAAGCAPELGECDLGAATAPLYYDADGYPAYPGQAIVDSSCGYGGAFCHTSAPDDPFNRFGAPAGLDLDVAAAREGDPAELDRLRAARRVAWNLRHEVYAQVQAGTMPPPSGESLATELGSRPRYVAFPGTPEARDLPTIESPEGQEILRNWLACGAHVIEATVGDSQGIGDIATRISISSCPDGQADCGSGCMDVSSDPANCGGCGIACGAGQACTAGACACLNAELDACGSLCVDLTSDVGHCGACGTDCGARFCAASSCVESCPSGTTDCGGSCVDLQSSPANCGGCGAPCGAGETCSAGTCSCASGFQSCGSGCVDTSRDPANCGACGTACASGESCTGGTCACASGTTDCGGGCVDTSRDPANCGACGNACPSGESCVAGACVGCGPTVSFSAQVEPILNRSCTASGCHGGARPAANLVLTTGSAYRELVGVAASCGSNPLVTPGDVDRSYLWNKLTDTGICSGTPMPKRGALLGASDLDLIRSWICRGAAND